MTRLYTNIRCEKCGEVYAQDIGVYYGKRVGDKGRTEGICTYCRLRELKERMVRDDR